jgi:hypothetical protein
VNQAVVDRLQVVNQKIALRESQLRRFGGAVAETGEADAAAKTGKAD